MSEIHPKFLRLEVEIQSTPPHTQLTFRINSDRFGNDVENGTKTLKKPIGHLLQEFDSIFEQVNATDQLVRRGKDLEFELQKLGMDLYRKLIPAPIQAKLWENRDLGIPLMISSREAIIPWSLLALESPEQGNLSQDGPFLAEAYQLTQGNDQVIPDNLRIHRIGVFGFGENLRQVSREVTFFKKYERCGLQVEIIEPKRDALRNAFEDGNFDVLHLCTHGLIESSNMGGRHPSKPQTPEIQTEDGMTFSLKHLSGAGRRFGACKPVVFFNGCFSSRPVQDLSGNTSWPQTLMHFGARAVVGAHFQIEDLAATQFAENFYNSFFAGNTFGEALLEARLSIKKLGCTRLAYVGFGHPLAKSNLGDLEAEEPSAQAFTSQNLRGPKFSHSGPIEHIRFLAPNLRDVPPVPESNYQALEKKFASRWNQLNFPTLAVTHSPDFQILTLLAIIKEPITPEMIHAFCGFDLGSILNVLHSWEAFLVKERAKDGDGSYCEAFAFADAKLGNFLETTLKRQGLSDFLTTMHRQIVELLHRVA